MEEELRQSEIDLTKNSETILNLAKVISGLNKVLELPKGDYIIDGIKVKI